MHGHHMLLAPAIGGLMNKVLWLAGGAGLAVLGGYLLSRSQPHQDLSERIDRLEALVRDLERSRGGATTG